MRKRGSAELLIFAVIAVAAVGVLFFQAQSVDISGAQTVARSVPRSGITACDNLNSMTIRLHQDFELQLDQYRLIAAKIKALLKIKFMLLQISNTQMKAAVLSCADWHRLVPGLKDYVSCDDLDKPVDGDDLKTCKSPDSCKGLLPGDKCVGPRNAGSQVVDCECDDSRTCLEVEERSDDPKLLIFQKNVWTLKKILILINIKLEAFFLQYSELHLNIKKHLDAVITLDSNMKDCFRRSCVTDCPDQSRTYVRDSSPRTAIPSATTVPRDQVAIPGAGQATQLPQDCESLCAQQGLSTQKPGPNDLLNAVKGYVCVSGASAKVSGKKVGDCTCWGKLEVSIDKTPVFCPAGKCGQKVPCNGQVSCQIGDTKVTESCKWGGWKIQGQGVTPIVGALVLE